MPNMHNVIQFKHTNVISTDIDHIPSNPLITFWCWCHIDNQRSKSHNEACFTDPQSCSGLVFLTESIWTSKIQTRYIDSKHQIADIMTKGNFTRDEWNNLLHLFNIGHFSSLRCTKNFSLTNCIAKARRIQEQKEGERVVSIFFSRCDMFLCRIKSDCIEKSGEVRGDPVAGRILKQVHSTHLHRLK